MLYHRMLRRKYSLVAISVFALISIVLFHSTISKNKATDHDLQWKEQHLPLVWKHIHKFQGQGGGMFFYKTK